MLTPARSRDNSKRTSRSTFSNPFKRRGSNAAIFATPSNASLQELSDIGFPETQIVIDAPPIDVNSRLWPPRQPLPRSSTVSALPPLISRMPDSPTGNRRQGLKAQDSSRNIASRIPTPSPRNRSSVSPIGAEPVPFRTPQVGTSTSQLYSRRDTAIQPVEVASNNMDTHLVDSELPLLRRARTTTTRPKSHRLSSYDVVVHQLLKPKSPALERPGSYLPIASSYLTSPERRDSALPPEAAIGKVSPFRLTPSGCVSRSPIRLRLKSPPPLLPPLTPSIPFDPTLTLPIPQNDDHSIPSDDPCMLDKQENSDEYAGDKRILMRKTLSRHTLRHSIDEDLVPVGDIFEARPTSYWTGRFVSLNDKLMTEAHDLPDPRDGDGEDKMRHLEVLRTKQIFDMLQICCKTPLASTSLKAFRRMYALKKSMPFLLDVKPAQSRKAIDVQRGSEESVADYRSLSDASTCAESTLSTDSGDAQVKQSGLVRNSETAKATFIGRLRRSRS